MKKLSPAKLIFMLTNFIFHLERVILFMYFVNIFETAIYIPFLLNYSPATRIVIHHRSFTRHSVTFFSSIFIPSLRNEFEINYYITYNV